MYLNLLLLSTYMKYVCNAEGATFPCMFFPSGIFTLILICAAEDPGMIKAADPLAELPHWSTHYTTLLAVIIADPPLQADKAYLFVDPEDCKALAILVLMILLSDELPDP